MIRASRFIAEANAKKAGKRELIPDWKRTLPEGSRWFPGCPGDPACKKCEGTGYLRLDLPLGHPQFGRMMYCDCVPESMILKEGELQ